MSRREDPTCSPKLVDLSSSDDEEDGGCPLELSSKPLPRPRDLYSQGKVVLERIGKLREIYKEMTEAEAQIPANLVQEVRAELNIEWIRRRAHEEAMDEDHNLQTIRELRELLAQREEEIDLLKQQLEMVDEATQKRPARLSFDNDEGDGQGPRVRLAGFGQNREKGAPGAKTLLSRECKSWR